MKSIAVLLSTYNGEKYLKEQIESLLNQSYKNITIFVRDDGSKDNTLKILDNYSSRLSIYKGKNIGINLSFLELLKKANGFDYYAFCDQDDIWEKNKIERAVDLLNKEDNQNIPILYAASYAVYDKEMKYLYSMKTKNNISFENALFETIAPGMTMVFNEKTREKLVETLNTECGLHDGWVNKICAGLGKILYDKSEVVKYRRYEGTATITKIGFFEKIKWKTRQFIIGKHWKNLKSQLIYYKKSFYNDLPNEKKRTLDLFTGKKNLIKQIQKTFYLKMFKENLIDEIKLRLMFFIWKI